jgi:hypothetical protein
MFETTTKEIRHREYPETWKLQARTWKSDATPEQIGNALGGNGAARPSRRGKLGPKRKSFGDSSAATAGIIGRFVTQALANGRLTVAMLRKGAFLKRARSLWVARR